MEPKGISKLQRISKIADEKFPRYKSYQSSKHQTKLKPAERDGSAENGQRHGQRGDSCEGVFVRSSGHREKERSKGKGTKTDDIVRYMSNLPGYLQRDERGEVLQGNALNFGVLDWTRLEKWKHEKKGGPWNDLTSSGFSVREKMDSKSSVFLKNTISQVDSHPSACSNRQASSKDEISLGFPHSVQRLRHSQEPNSASHRTYGEQKAKSLNFKPSRKDRSGVIPGTSKQTMPDLKFASGIGNSSANMRNSKVLMNESSQNTESKMRREETQEPTTNKKEMSWRMATGYEPPSPKPMKDGLSTGFSDELRVVNDKTRKNVEDLPDPVIDLTHDHKTGESRNVILLVPDKHAQKTHQEKPKTSFLKESKCHRFSNGLARQDLQSSEACSQIPHSCPLSYGVESDSASDAMPLNVGLSWDASGSSTSRDKREKVMRDNKLSGSSDSGFRCTDNAKSMDMLDEELFEGSSRKRRHPSPNQRFSFSFSRIGRSFSFKETSSVPQLSSSHASVKSGPVTFDDSACQDGSNAGGKPYGHNRARSSPFRRILDPILKSKVVSSIHSTESAASSRGRTKSFDSKPLKTDEQIQKANKETSKIRAFVQFTVRNGLPLFQFVVDNNNSSVLAATMKKSVPSGKDDSVQYCTFYSVNEVKKKSSRWIGQQSKKKHLGFVYNIIGQMKLYNSLTSDLIWHNSESHCIVQESVLYEIEVRQADQTSEKLRPGRELAAVVVRMSDEKPNHHMQHNDTSLSVKVFTDNISTAVILPGAVHGFPDKGAPSPLIDRWRSGGLCDCGGWDIGCKLRVLSTKAQLNHYQFQLFDEEGTQRDAPAFALVPLKSGIYSVEFTSSVSMLQAFFISVTVLSSHIPLDLSAPRTLPEPKACLGLQMNRPDRTQKNPPPPARETPAKYASNPPLSPVGRV